MIIRGMYSRLLARIRRLILECRYVVTLHTEAVVKVSVTGKVVFLAVYTL